MAFSTDWIVLSLLLALRSGAAEPVPPPADAVKLAVLPLCEINPAARQGRVSRLATVQICSELAERPELELVDAGGLDAFQEESRQWLSLGEHGEAARAIGRQAGAALLLTGTVARFGFTSESATFIDVRLLDGDSGDLLAWGCERADVIREASMTTSSPESEQMERLGSSIAAAVRRVGQRQRPPLPEATAVVPPFQEPGDGRYGPALARMLATDLMDLGVCRVIPAAGPPAGLDTPGLVRWAQAQSAAFLFLGEVVTSATQLNEIRVSQLSVETGQTVRRARDSFASDLGLRIATAHLAQSFSAGGEHILWRWQAGGPLRGTPAFAGGKVLVGSPGPALAALHPFTGQSLWVYEPGALARTAGPRFLACAGFEGRAVTLGSAGGTLFTCDLKTGKHAPTGDIPLSGPADFPRWILADADQIDVTPGTFSLHHFDAETLKERWRFTDRSTLWLAHQPASETVVVASWNGRVTALARSDGKRLWQHQLPARVLAAPLVSEGCVAVGAEDGTRTALALADGRVLWRRRQGGRCLATPASGPESVFFADETGVLSALRSSDGEPQGDVPLGGVPQVALTFHEGILYAAASDGYLYSIGTSPLRILWRTFLRGPWLSAPLVVPIDALVDNEELEGSDWPQDADHLIFVASSGGTVYALTGHR